MPMKKTATLTSENPPEFPPPRPRNRRLKKSQESMNFSDCNCCYRQIHSKTPKNGAEILKSEWRIVILCKNCYNLVEKSEICSYCLIRVSSEFYDCVKCRRRIHKDCAEKFSGDFCDDFSVCFDCWIPSLLENEFNRSRKIRKKQLGENFVDRKSILLEKENCLEDVVNEAEKKIVAVVEAKENAFRKIMAVNKVVEFARASAGIFTIDEDGELASRVSRDECLLNTHCVDVPTGDEMSWSSRGTNVASGIGIDESREIRRESGSSIITYSRKGRVPKDCALKLYSKKPSQVAECKEETNCEKERASGDVNCEEETECALKLCSWKPSQVEECKEENDCALKLYSRKPCQASELEAVQRLPQLVDLEAGKIFKYTRRRLHCKSMVGNGSLNCENANRGADMLLTCHEEPMSLTNAA